MTPKNQVRVIITCLVLKNIFPSLAFIDVLRSPRLDLGLRSITWAVQGRNAEPFQSALGALGSQVAKIFSPADFKKHITPTRPRASICLLVLGTRL